MSATYTTRFAPSPTGRLHLGHAYSALLAHDAARAVAGRFLLRIEDIDQTRCRPEHVDGIYEDLHWLGLNWDGEVMFQSNRAGAYAKALQTIADQGLAYKCWCTRAEVAANIDAPQDGAMPLYPGTCRGRQDPGDAPGWAVMLDRRRSGANCRAVGGFG
jgi:glutamyl-Q tRNA(Asp) synthetase